MSRCITGSPARSLLVKVGMLAVTSALIVLIGWQMPMPPAGDLSAPPPSDPTGVPATSPIPVLPMPASTSTQLLKTGDAQAPVRAASKVDLNRASVQELQNLPGIGAVIAKRVVDRRTAHGPFKQIEELGDVKGIGRKRLAALRPLVMVVVPAARTTRLPRDQAKRAL